MSLVVPRTRPSPQGRCAAVQHSKYGLWNQRSVGTRVNATALTKCTATLLRAQNYSTAATATSAGPIKSSRGHGRFRSSTELRVRLDTVPAEAAETTPQAAATADDDAASSLSANKIGILSAEFGPEALQALSSAASAASRARAVAAASCKAENAAFSANRAPPGDLEQEYQRVLVTEQYLMMALLQQQPDAVDFIAQHTIFDQQSADLQQEPSVLIQEKLAGILSGTERSGGEAAGKGSSDEVPAGELQLSAQVLRVLNDALTITRQQGQNVVLWPSLLWGLMRVPNAHVAYEQVLGAKLLSADVREQARLLIRQQADKAEFGSSTISSSMSVAAHCKLQSWMDYTLDQALAGAQGTALEQCNLYEAVLTAAVAISSAAEAGYQPAVAWLEAAWGLIKEVVTTLYDEHRDISWSDDEPDCTALPDKEHYALAAGVAAAAYASVLHLGFTGPDMFCAVHEVVDARYHSLFSDVWLQLVIAAAADPAQSMKALQRFHRHYSRPSDVCRLGTQDFSPAKGLSLGFLPILLQDTKRIGMSKTTSTDPTTDPTISTRLCELLLRDMPYLDIADVCTLAGHASAIWKGCSPPQQQQWLKVLELCVQRLCSQPPESISTAELLRAYTAIFCLPRDQLMDAKLQLVQLLVARSSALSSHAIVSKNGRVCAGTTNQCTQMWPELPATTSERQLTSTGENQENDIEPEIAAEMLSMLSVLAMARQGAEVMSIQHLDGLLQTIVAQHRYICQCIEQSGRDPLPMQALVKVLLPIVEAAASTSAPSAARGTSSAAAAAAHLASMLHSVQQLPLYLSVEKMNELVVGLLGWLPQSLQEPDQLGQVIRFVAKQQLQLGRDSEGLTLSKDILWHNQLDRSMHPIGLHKQA